MKLPFWTINDHKMLLTCRGFFILAACLLNIARSAETEPSKNSLTFSDGSINSFQRVKEKILAEAAKLESGKYTIDLVHHEKSPRGDETVDFKIWGAFDKPNGKLRFERWWQLQGAKRVRAVEDRCRFIQCGNSRSIWNPLANAVYRFPTNKEIGTYKSQVSPIDVHVWPLLEPFRLNMAQTSYKEVLGWFWDGKATPTAIHESETEIELTWTARPQKGPQPFVISLIVDKSRGWNIRQLRTTAEIPTENGFTTVPLYENKVQLKEINGCWVPSQVDFYSFAGLPENARVTTARLNFEWESVNEELSPVMFTEESFETRWGTLIIDMSGEEPELIGKGGFPRLH